MYEHVKNQLNSSIHSWDTADYTVLWPKRIFDHAHPVTIKVTFSFLKDISISMQKKQLDSTHWNVVEIRVPCQFLPTAIQKSLK